MESLKKINARIEKLGNERKAIKEMLNRHNYNTYGEYKTACGGETGISSLMDKNELITLQIKLLKCNAVYSFYDEIKPALFETLEKFSGKKCGEKTLKKMQEYFYNLTSHKLYFSGSRDITIIFINEKGFHNCGDLEIKISGLYNREKQETFYFLDNNNILCVPGENDIFISNGYKDGYIENVNQHAKKIIAAYEKVKKAKKEYEKMISNYNELLTSDIDCLWINSNIYDRLYY